LKCSLTGDAAQILWDSPEVDKMNFSQLVDKLKGRYGTAGQREKFAVELLAIRRKRNQSVAELHHDVRKLLVLAYPGYGNSELFEVIGRDHFLRALDNVELEMKLRDKEPENLDAAFKAALRIEACIKSLDVEERIPRVQRSREEERINRQVRLDDLETQNRMRELERQVNDLRKESDNLQRQGDRYDKELGRLKSITVDRSSAMLKSAQDVQEAGTTETRKSMRCFRCGRLGHMARSCRQSPGFQQSARSMETSETTMA
jgi:hypothetical protein